MSQFESANGGSGPSDTADLGRRTLRKVAWRLIPFLCFLYIFNIIDRANVGFARLTMEKDLEIDAWVFDIGIGLFYFGYLLFEVPSNLILRRVGARRWIGRIMISWGLITCLTMGVSNAWNFSLVRILLGIAEAGFFPGIVLYLTFWFPARERARVVAWFMMAIALASVFGNPLSGAIMQYLHGTWDLVGWQWVFLLEGLPSVLLGLAVLYYLPDGPAEASWLTQEERDWLVAHLHAEEQERVQRHGAVHLRALLEWRVWLLICIYFTVAVGANAAGAYYPKLLRRHFAEADDFGLGLLSALPHLCAVIAMTLYSWNSDRTGERRLHVAFAALVAACGWALAALTTSPELFLVGLCIAQMGMMSMLPPFWALPTAFLSGAAAAGGIALINSVGNIGGALGPSIVGLFGPETVAGILFASFLLALCVRREQEVRVADVKGEACG